MQTCLRNLIWTALLCGVAAPGHDAGGQQAAMHRPELSHSLQGMYFIGPLRVQGEKNPGDDRLTFRNGMFTSRTCQRYGFGPAPYWVQSDADGSLHFLAVLRNPEHGTIRFEGIYDGREVVATALWTKERWYWTVEQKFYFEGRPVPPESIRP